MLSKNKLLFFFFIVSCVVSNTNGAPDPGNKEEETAVEPAEGEWRDGKFIPYVKVVSFENTPCVGTNGLVGTCYSKKDCGGLNGESSGNCAHGYGVCCIVSATCDDKVVTNNTYFKNPNYPATYTSNSMCMIEIWPTKGSVQIKLDFLAFDIAGPVDGDCGNDTFTFTGANVGSKVPILCGFNSGQHMFLDIDNSNGPFKLIFNTGGVTQNRNWNILISFLSDYDPCKAPPRCLQYYNDASGTINSFNFGMQAQSQLLNELHYSICFAYIPGFCDIGLSFSTLDQGVLDGATCVSDFLGIQGTSLCGTQTALTITANATGPNIIYVKTDFDNSLQQEGFSFSYMHLPCG